MSYKLDYTSFPSFLKELQKYNSINSNHKNYKEMKKKVIEVLRNSPRSNQSLLPHPLNGKLKEYWAISTGLNSNKDRIIYGIDEELKTIVLKSIGNHSIYESMYESMLEYWKKNEII